MGLSKIWKQCIHKSILFIYKTNKTHYYLVFCSLTKSRSLFFFLSMSWGILHPHWDEINLRSRNWLLMIASDSNGNQTLANKICLHHFLCFQGLNGHESLHYLFSFSFFFLHLIKKGSWELLATGPLKPIYPVLFMAWLG